MSNVDVPCSFDTSSETMVFPLLSSERSLTTSAPKSCAHALIALSRDSLVGRKRYGIDKSAFCAYGSDRDARCELCSYMSAPDRKGLVIQQFERRR